MAAAEKVTLLPTKGGSGVGWTVMTGTVSGRPFTSTENCGTRLSSRTQEAPPLSVTHNEPPTLHPEKAPASSRNDAVARHKKPDGFVARFGGQCIAVNAQRAIGANVLDVMQGLKKTNADLNAGTNIGTTNDTAGNDTNMVNTADNSTNSY